MAELCSIPLNYREGVYGISDFTEEAEDVIVFDHDEYGDILTYQIPAEDDYREIVLYDIPKEELTASLNASYDGNGQLKTIAATVRNRDTILYIHHADCEAAIQEIVCFAAINSNLIIEQICSCTDVIARLFIEYFYDGEAMDFHAKLGTAAQKDALEKEYPDDDTIADYSGSFPSENIEGDNTALKIMITCAECVKNEGTNFFQYAVDIMSGHIREKAVEKLRKTDDFKFICSEYD